MNTRAGSNAWKLTALIVGGVLAARLICLMGCALGSVIGFSLRKREGSRYYLPPYVSAR